MAKEKKGTKKFIRKRLASTIRKRRLNQKEGAKRRKEEEKEVPEEVNELVMKEDDVHVEEGDFEDFLNEELASEEEENEFFEGSGSEEEEGDENDEDDDLGDEVTHAKDLEQLKESDPEFYKFLQQNDPGALQFEIEDEEDEDNEEETKIPSWIAQAQRSGKAGKSGVSKGAKAFLQACQILAGDMEEELIANTRNVELCVRWGLGPGVKLVMTKGQKYDGKRLCKGLVLLVKGGEEWRKLALHVLAEEQQMWSMVVQYGQTKKTTQAVLDCWVSNNEGEREAGFIAVRKGVLSVPHPHSSNIVRACHAYLALRGHKERDGGQMEWMVECVAELYGLLHFDLQYPLLYVALRQHALQLRGVLAETTRPTNSLYNWPILLSLRAACVSIRNGAEKGQLTQLIYPAVHLIEGMLQYYHGGTWIPCQLLLLDMLLLLGPFKYIPIASHATRLLMCILLATNAPNPPTTALPDVALKISKAALSQKGPQREMLVERLLGVIERDALCLQRSPAFPEWSVPLSRQLRYLCRYAPARISKLIRQLASALENNSRHILSLRGKVKLTPRQPVAVAKALMEDKQPTPIAVYIASKIAPSDFLQALFKQREVEMAGGAVSMQEGEEEQSIEEWSEEEEEEQEQEEEDDDEEEEDDEDDGGDV